MPRNRHPDKEIEEAIAFAEDIGWHVVSVKGHAWGRLYCAHHDRDGCKVSVWSTPLNGGDHARDIVRALKRCPHQERKEDCDENS